MTRQVAYGSLLEIYSPKAGMPALEEYIPWVYIQVSSDTQAPSGAPAVGAEGSRRRQSRRLLARARFSGLRNTDEGPLLLAACSEQFPQNFLEKIGFPFMAPGTKRKSILPSATLYLVPRMGT